MIHQNNMRNQQLRRQSETYVNGFIVESSLAATAYLERKKHNACEADRTVELKQEVKKLDPEMPGLKAKLKNEKPKLKKHSSFRSFLRSFFCLKT
ncbi:hypothetical protein Bca4012_024764 [Brassica carinata]|uniref:Uncharacterized protein n=1 Tax=Brassica carinata TaxID=52824 RepID=A0A8X8ASH4_BRACI|nr:hypothetical protein Bca52824_021825 [Brassica carinata]